MDRIGTIMGVVTIPMALLTLLSALAGLWLLVAGQALPVGLGIGAALVGVALAWVLDHVVAWGEAGALALRGRSMAVGQTAAILCGFAPMLVLLGWEYAAFDRLFARAAPGASPIMLWLWSYGVATGPWTVHAQLVGSDRRTLCGIRSYAGHLGYWLLTLGVLAGFRPVAAFALMTLPSILPGVVGALLAVADREALRNVRI